MAETPSSSAGAVELGKGERGAPSVQSKSTILHNRPHTDSQRDINSHFHTFPPIHSSEFTKWPYSSLG